MRAVYLIAGAGGMYCGSCLRDNRLAAALLAQGRDIVLVPLYTPIRTDEIDVSRPEIYYGGINVYLQQKSAAFRMLPRWATRVLDARTLLRRAMKYAGQTKVADLGTLTLSILKGEHGAQRAELERLIEGLRSLEPDVINLPNLLFVGLARRLKEKLGAAVLCTLSGEDIFLDQLLETHRREAHDLIRERGRDIDGFIAVTNYFARFSADHFQLPSERIHVVPMGVQLDDVGQPASPAPGPFTIGYLARICPEKGLATLAQALALLRRDGRDVRVRAAGYLGPSDRRYLEDTLRSLRTSGAHEAFEHVGEVDRAGKIAFLRSLHALSVPTVYHEAKGLYLLEAMACGVPVVQPRHGSFPELVEATGGGLLYDPTGPEALAEAIAKLMDDDMMRQQMAERGRAAVHESFSDALMAKRTWELYERLAARRTATTGVLTHEA